MKLTPHFTLAEFEASETAARKGIDNSVPPDLLEAVRRTALMLEAVRALLSKHAGREVPILLNSGYRSPALNDAIGGSAKSDHMTGDAADIIAPRFGTPREIAKLIEPIRVELGIGQLALEYPSRGGWVHLSTRIAPKPINRVITIDSGGTVAGIESA